MGARCDCHGTYGFGDRSFSSQGCRALRSFLGIALDILEFPEREKSAAVLGFPGQVNLTQEIPRSSDRMVRYPVCLDELTIGYTCISSRAMWPLSLSASSRAWSPDRHILRSNGE